MHVSLIAKSLGWTVFTHRLGPCTYHFLEQRGYVPYFGHMDVLFVLKDALRDDFGVGLRRPFRESFVTQP